MMKGGAAGAVRPQRLFAVAFGANSVGWLNQRIGLPATRQTLAEFATPQLFSDSQVIKFLDGVSITQINSWPQSARRCAHWRQNSARLPSPQRLVEDAAQSVRNQSAQRPALGGSFAPSAC